MEIPDKETASISSLPKDIQSRLQQVAETMESYHSKAMELLDIKYSDIKNLVPLHLKDPGITLVLCCSDGVIIRFEKNMRNKD